jgi:cell division protein FtsQ
VRLPRFRVRILAAIAVLVLGAGGAWLWLRDSSLVQVNGVTVTGASGPNAGRIDAALEAAAHGMTTLHVDIGKLRESVAGFPSVKDIKVSTSFPHGMRIRVIEQQAAAVLSAPGQRVAVAGDGTVLRDAAVPGGLPTLSVGALPSGPRVTDTRTLAILAVLGAAPYQLLAHVQSVADNASHGVVVQLRNGPSLYFGDPGLDSAKWTAASDVLADPGSVGAGYIDVTDPRRPAAGAG